MFVHRILLAALLVALPSAAQAQYYPPNPYNPYYNPYAGVGSALAGQAEQIRAVGDLNIAQEKSRIEREKANQAKLQTQKMAFDQMLYERSLKPTYAEDVKYVDNRIVSRMMSSPNPNEIAKGKTLNAFMPYILKLSETGVQGPPVPINQAALKKVNVTTGETGPQIGILKNQPIIWPLALRGPLQQKCDPLLRTAVSGAATGALTPKQLNDVRALVKQIETDFLNRFRQDEVSASDYLAANHFLENLNLGLMALSRPDINQFFDGSLTPHGNNVPELCFNMSGQGTTFAPGNPGTEASYRSLHDSFVGYIRSAQTSSGFQPRMRPPNPLSANNPGATER